jgi:predicted  nucleic acid-binding Zn-ribbon protein
MAKIIQEAIEASNLPGFDYIEFRDSLVRMAGVPMTEEQKFQAVFATAQSMGVTKQVLLDAVDHYLKVIGSKAAEFESFVSGVEVQQVTSKEKSVTDLATTIEGEAAEINRLTMSIQEHRKQQDAINLEIVQAKRDIQNKRSAFEATRSAIANNLTSDRTKIETYLK